MRRLVSEMMRVVCNRAESGVVGTFERFDQSERRISLAHDNKVFPSQPHVNSGKKQNAEIKLIKQKREK